MAQYARPSSGISDGDWITQGGPTDLYDCIDETSASDTEYIQLDGTPLSPTCRIGLSSVTDPSSSSGHILRWRERAEGSLADETGTVELYQDTTLIATAKNAATITRGSWSDQSYTLSSGEADSITDYSSLEIRFTGDAIIGIDQYLISWAELEVPDAATFIPRYVGVI